MLFLVFTNSVTHVSSDFGQNINFYSSPLLHSRIEYTVGVIFLYIFGVWFFKHWGTYSSRQLLNDTERWILFYIFSNLNIEIHTVYLSFVVSILLATVFRLVCLTYTRASVVSKTVCLVGSHVDMSVSSPLVLERITYRLQPSKHKESRRI